MTLPGWPVPVVQVLREHLGETALPERLGGMGGAAVFRVRGQGSRIVKRGVRANEAHVYRERAAGLRAAGLSLPEVFLIWPEGRRFWLVMEDLKLSLPRERWLADPAALAMLARIHALPVPRHAAAYRGRWPVSLTTRALGALRGLRLPTDGLQQPLDVMRQRALPWLRPQTAIHGDPNALNWALGPRGQLVLLDWERFGAGTPAVDLAISVPGLGPPEQMRLVVERYREQGGVLDGAADELAAGLLAVKAWTFVDLLARSNPRVPARAQVATDLFPQLRPWLAAAL